VRFPFEALVGPLPPDTVAKRDDDLAWLAMIIVTGRDGEQLVADMEAAPTAEGAAAKVEGLTARWNAGLVPDLDEVRKFLDEHGWPARTLEEEE
jgi:hypothetical protein